MLEKDEFTDVTIVAGGGEFRAHKCIMAARSSVFAAMFKHNFIEKQESTVTITDLNYDVLQELLKYIYTAKVDSLNLYAADLLAAGDKVHTF